MSAPGGPEVSVVIPARDVAAVIGEQLAALAAQRGAPRFEVVVADKLKGKAAAKKVIPPQDGPAGPAGPAPQA